MNLLTQFSYEILHGYYNTLYALIDGMVSKIETTLNIFSSSGNLWDLISDVAFSVHDVLSRAHEISRVFMRFECFIKILFDKFNFSLTIDMIYKIEYAQNVFKYAETFVSDVPIISQIYDAVMFLSDQVGEVIVYFLEM